jgi:putative transposase
MAPAIGVKYAAAHGPIASLLRSRFAAAIVDDERYLLTCMRYVELNPIRAGMVMDPRDYPWSSHRANALGENDDLVRPHPIYLRLGCNPDKRQEAYCELFGRPIPNPEIETIRDATQNAWALGDTKFRQRISVSGRRPTRVPRGRAPPEPAETSQADPGNRV